MPGVRARTRAVVTAAAAVAALVSTGSLVSAHGGASNAVHACIVPSSGYLRVVDASADCKKGETPIDWSLGSGLAAGSVTGQGNNLVASQPVGALALETVGRANIVAGAIDTAQLANNAVTASKLASALLADLVTEAELTAALDAILPIAAADIAAGAIDATKLAADAVSGGSGGAIKDGTITAADLAGHYSAGPWDTEIAGAITGEKVRDGTIEARDIANGAVTAIKLAAGAVTGGHVANGSLSPDDTTANAASSTAAGPTEVAVGSSESFGQLELTVAGGVHAVHVTGQGVVECTACTDAADSVTVQWTLVDGGLGVIPQTPAVTLTSTDRMATLPISFLVPDAAAGAHSYSVEISVLAGGSDPVVASSFGLVAVDLGRAPGP